MSYCSQPCQIWKIVFWLFFIAFPLHADDEADQAFFRASKIYEYGRNTEDPEESKDVLRTAEQSYRTFIKTYTNHPKKLTAHYRMAVSQLLIGNMESAEANFKQILKQYKTGQLVAASAYRLATQYYNQKSYLTASKFYKIASQKSMKDSLKNQSLYLEARCQMLLGKKRLAIPPLKKLLEGELDSTYRNSSLLALAHIYYEVSDFKLALEYFTRLKESEDVDENTKSEATLYVALTSTHLGDQEKAEEIIVEVLNAPNIKDYHKAKAQYTLYKIYYDNDQVEDILNDRLEGIYNGENSVVSKTHLLIGYASLKKDYCEDAVYSFDQVRNLSPNTALSFEASYRRIYALHRLKNPNINTEIEQFQKTYQTYRKEHHWHKLAKLYQAEHFYKESKYEKAAKVYRSINSDDLPESIRANFLFKKLVSFAYINDHDSAISTAGFLIKAYAGHELFVETKLRRAESYYKDGNFPSALNDYTYVLKAEPDSMLVASALQGMIKIYREERKYERLIESAKLLIDKFPKLKDTAKAHAYYWKGWAHFKREEFEKCIPDFRQSRAILPEYYKEPAGTRIFLSSYYLLDSDIMKDAYYRMQKDVPGKYFPPRILAWFGIQRFQNKDHVTASKVLNEIANRENALETPLDVWRYLAKSALTTKQYDLALESIEYVLEREKEEFWKADALLDKTQALLGIENGKEALATANKGLYYKPKGTIEARLRFSRAEANELIGDYNGAKDEYLLIADKFTSDHTIRPLALWKAVLILEEQNNPVSEAIRNTLEEEYPKWVIPELNS